MMQRAIFERVSLYAKSCMRFSLMGVLVALLSFQPLFSMESAAGLKDLSKSFTSIAKSATPAVVSIEVRSTRSERGRHNRSFRGEDPFDFFNDEFFRDFFGVPRRDSHGQQQQPQQRNPRVGRGSGIIVSHDGYILTNNHVIDGADQIFVISNDGTELEAKVIGSDPGTDVAVVKVEATGLPFLEFSDSDVLEVGEWVVAIGNPLGFQASVTAGIVSAKGRNNLHITDFGDLIQTDAAINPGNSGGPLIDLEGNVVGVNTAIVSTSGGYMGIGFAIPSNMAKHVMTQIIKTGAVTRGFLGIAPQDLDRELATSFKLDRAEGVLIADVVAGSPAEESGLQRGDIILSVNGLEVKSSVEISKTIGLMAPGAKVDLVVYRKGKTVDISVVIGTHPKNRQSGAYDEMLGLEVEPLSPELAEQFSHYNEKKGVVITSVEPYSPAGAAGLRPGDLILAVDRKEVASVGDYYEAVKEAIQDKRVLLLVKQGKVMRFIPLRLDKPSSE